VIRDEEGRLSWRGREGIPYALRSRRIEIWTCRRRAGKIDDETGGQTSVLMLEKEGAKIPAGIRPIQSSDNLAESTEFEVLLRLFQVEWCSS